MARLRSLVCALLTLVFCISVIDAEPTFRTDYKYFDATKAYYKHYKTNVPWPKAKSTCESDGGRLYFPENVEELNLVKTLYRDNIWLWLGISRVAYGDIRTVDGRDINEVYHKWDLGEPNNLSGSENCIVLMNEDGKMNDYHCHALYSFVCKVPLSAVENDIPVVVVQSEIPTGPKVGHRNFYKYYANPETWENAKKLCEDEASTLVVPDDEIELGSIVDYTNQTYWRNWIWLGASKNTQFTTVDGRLLDDVYVNWSPREPVNDDGDENCVVLCRDGCYRARACYERLPFMCKTSVFVSAITPEKGRMDPSVLKNPLEFFESVPQNHFLPNCTEGVTECDTNCGKVEKDSQVQTNFGNIVANELKNYPSNKKLDTMFSIMRVLEEKWSLISSECKIKN